MSHYQNIQNESSDDENESEEQQQPHDEYYEEVRGEYDDGEYEEAGEEYWYIHSGRESISKTHSQSVRSSPPTSEASTVSGYRRHPRKSLKKTIVGGKGYSIAEEEIQHQDNQDLIDAMPEDISSSLLEYWQYMEDLYYPINERSFEGINKSHKKLLDYPLQFHEQYSKLLDAPDGRANLAELFKTDFNRVPFATRNNDQIKPVLMRRINEFTERLESVTEEKYAKSKRMAYNILSKGVLTSESEKLARRFGTLVQAETDRFADTIRFINEHYYTTIAIDLAMPNKVRWKEIMDIGLIKKKFLCEHFREQCLLREHLQDGESFREGETTGSSSDTDICGGGTRGQDFSQICEEETDSTPSNEELSDDSSFDKYRDEDEEIDFGDNEGKMDGEMKLSLEFDNDEFLGEGGWEAFSNYRNSADSAEMPRKSDTGVDEDEIPKLHENEEIMSAKDSSQKGKANMKSSPSKTKATGKGNSGAHLETLENGAGKMNKPERKSEKVNATEKKKSSEGSKKKRKTKSKSKQVEEEEIDEEEDAFVSNFEYPEEEDEELEMELENVEADNHAFFDEEEYPGEFWEGEGYDRASFRNSKGTNRNRDSSVKFDEKETYIRDFFWDSDPSKQDATDMSKAGEGKDKGECMDEGYFDEEEIFDDEDVFYDRDEFFETETENQGTSKSAIKSQDLHFAIFGREVDLDSNNMSLLNKLLLRWSSNRVVENKKSKDDMADEIEVKFMGTVDDDEGEEGEEEEEEEDGQSMGRVKSFSSIGITFSPTTPASANRENNTDLKLGILNTMAMFEDLNGAKLHSFSVPFVNTDVSKPISGLLLKLHPDSAVNDSPISTTVEMMQQKLPLLKCFINLQDEIWNGFEVAFREARQNIEKVISSLKDVVAKAYPIEEPKDPCEEEPDINVLLAKGEAIKDKYRVSSKQSDRMPKTNKHVHLKESFIAEEEIIEIEGEGASPTPEIDEEEEEEENNLGTPKSSVVELVPLQPQSKTSAELELMENDQLHEKRSSLVDSEGKKKKRVSIEESGKSGSLTKTSANLNDLGAGSAHGKNSAEDVAEDEMVNDKKSSITNYATAGELENGASFDQLNSTQSDGRTESTDRKSVYLERTPADTDIRLPIEEILMEPNPEEKRILRKAKHALLKTKLQNWENSLNMEAERLIRQLALIESHAQHEFCLLKQLPLYVWEKSKSQAANVYKEDLQRDAEVGEIFKCATKDGSPLYGKFYIDRRDLMLLIKENDPPIPLKYTDEFLELSTSLSGKKKSKKSEYIDMEE